MPVPVQSDLLSVGSFGRMYVVPPLADVYRIDPTHLQWIITPALLIYPDLVKTNIQATLKLAGGNPNRWRPHLKTAKIPAVIELLLAAGVRNVKCSTTRELMIACEAGATDVLLAFSALGANARRVLQLAKQYGKTKVSVLVETADQIAIWLGEPVGIFLDINSGMNRTGMDGSGREQILELARLAGEQFRGLHYYDGHMSGVPQSDREERTHEGYRQIASLVEYLAQKGVRGEELITSGTPAAPYALSFRGFEQASPFVHRISPGTVVYNDMTSLEQLPGFGYEPAALVLSTVISHPTPNVVTCDAGHKSVSADAGVPTCTVLSHEGLTPLKPSEEHLPIDCGSSGICPPIGSKLFLLPKHVCPTVNNFDEAFFIRDGRISAVETVAGRGHEALLVEHSGTPQPWTTAS